MTSLVSGIHHITAVASDPQRTVDFYTKVLGLRLVKKSVNQDQVEAYHLFFGDSTGEPGMDLTFFTFPQISKGRAGVGQVTRTLLSVPNDALDFWQQRLVAHQVGFEKTLIADHQAIYFQDADGQPLGLVETDYQNSSAWKTDEIHQDVAIQSFYAAELTVSQAVLVQPILEQVLRYQLIAESEDYVLLQRQGTDRANRLLLKVDDQHPGVPGAGTVHHIAFTVFDEQHQLQLQQQVRQLGLQPTQVIDRYYFKSVYLRTPAGILFELATPEPGFTVDESVDTLGEKLALPPFLEDQREEIEAGLVEIG